MIDKKKVRRQTLQMVVNNMGVKGNYLKVNGEDIQKGIVVCNNLDSIETNMEEVNIFLSSSKSIYGLYDGASGVYKTESLSDALEIINLERSERVHKEKTNELKMYLIIVLDTSEDMVTEVKETYGSSLDGLGLHIIVINKNN